MASRHKGARIAPIIKPHEPLGRLLSASAGAVRAASTITCLFPARRLLKPPADPVMPSVFSNARGDCFDPIREVYGCARRTSNLRERRTPARRSTPPANARHAALATAQPRGRVVNIGFELCRPLFQAAFPSAQPGGSRSWVVGRCGPAVACVNVSNPLWPPIDGPPPLPPASAEAQTPSNNAPAVTNARPSLRITSSFAGMHFQQPGRSRNPNCRARLETSMRQDSGGVFVSATFSRRSLRNCHGRAGRPKIPAKP